MSTLANVQLTYLSPVVSGGPVKFSGTEVIRKDRARFPPSLGHSLSPVSIPRGRTRVWPGPRAGSWIWPVSTPHSPRDFRRGVLFTFTPWCCRCAVWGPPHSAKRVLTQMVYLGHGRNIPDAGTVWKRAFRVTSVVCRYKGKLLSCGSLHSVNFSNCYSIAFLFKSIHPGVIKLEPSLRSVATGS